MPFTKLGLHSSLVQATRDMRYAEPTPVQAEAIPVILAGRDLIATAQTGTGKTAAFLLPILHRLLDGPRNVTQALVLTPTRELAQQIDDVLLALAYHTTLRGGIVVGGTAMGPQEKALRAGVELVVATPGRLLDHMRQNQTRFDHIHTLVLDEADRMMDMGFLPDLKRIIARLPARRQTLLFSATMPPVIARLAADILRDPKMVQIGRRSTPAVGITQAAYPVPEHLKTTLLRHLLRHTDMPSVLVFTRTKQGAPPAVADHRRGRFHGRRAAQQPDAAAADAGDGSVSQGRHADPGGDQHRRPRPRRGPHHARHQRGRAGRPRGLRSPHRPHRTDGGGRGRISCWWRRRKRRTSRGSSVRSASACRASRCRTSTTARQRLPDRRRRRRRRAGRRPRRKHEATAAAGGGADDPYSLTFALSPSFPNSVRERTPRNSCFASSPRAGRETEFRRQHSQTEFGNEGTRGNCAYCGGILQLDLGQGEERPLRRRRRDDDARVGVRVRRVGRREVGIPL